MFQHGLNLRTLVSSGAENFAAGSHVEMAPPGTLIAPGAYERWQKWKKRLENVNTELSAIEDEETIADSQDTVGAVVFHERDGLASGVSR
jgi:taspase (threonine aspartase 1)